MTRPHAPTTRSTIEVGELLYEAVLRFKSVTAFGASLEALATGTATPPPEGARFDFAFEGQVCGPKLTGQFTGIDYANVRADGHYELDIRGHLATSDGQSIAVAGGGIARAGARAGTYDLREHFAYRTAAASYAWINQVQAWVVGTVDLAAGELRVTAYAA
jgi:hypothetical protein